MSRWGFILFGTLVLVFVTMLNVEHVSERGGGRGWSGGSSHSSGGSWSSGGGGGGHK